MDITWTRPEGVEVGDRLLTHFDHPRSIVVQDVEIFTMRSGQDAFRFTGADGVLAYFRDEWVPHLHT